MIIDLDIADPNQAIRMMALLSQIGEAADLGVADYLDGVSSGPFRRITRWIPHEKRQEGVACRSEDEGWTKRGRPTWAGEDAAVRLRYLQAELVGRE